MKRKAFFVAISITLCSLFVCFVFGNNNFLSKPLRFALTPVFTIVSASLRGANNLKTYFNEAENIKQKNLLLENENSRLKYELQSMAEYKNKIERLEKLLNLKDESENNFKVTAAKVVSHTPDNWHDTIMINKGKESGVAIGDAVLTSAGVVGKVSEVGSRYSMVSTLFNHNNSIAVRNVRTGELGVVSGAQKLCKMSFISDDSSINVGDILETTGAGGVYPEGIIVGTIKEIKASDFEVYAVVEPASSMWKIYEVLVVSSGSNQYG